MTYKLFPVLPFSALAAAMLIPQLASAQSILLTADDFVLLGGTAVTVGGAGPNTFSNGNVGSAASIEGFPPATIVNGTTILGGPIVGQALIDLGSARDKLNALIVDPANNLTGQDLGGMTLTPGVYGFDVAAEITLAGTKILQLDAQGKNNVTWVINIGTTLTTAAGAQIEFINLGSNGGADNGLFWNAGTSITFGADNIIAGNYLAAESITFGTALPAVGSGSGRALAHQIVSFDGQATMDALGGPGGGDMTGGLALNNEGELVTSGYVLLSADGIYTQGVSNVILTPGNVYNTPGVIVDGNMSDGLNGEMLPIPSKFTVFQTIATLTGTENTYTGGTVVDSGILTTGTANLPTDGTVELIDSNETGTFGVIIFDQSEDDTFGGVISGGGSVTKENTGIVTLTGANTYTGGTFINGGALAADSASLPVDGAVTLANDSALVFDQSEDGSFGGLISGAGSVGKQGDATATLTAANTYTGGTTLDAGTLALSGDGTLGATTGDLEVNEATLDLGETSQTVGAVSLNGGTIENGTLNGTSYTSTGGSISAIITGEDVVFTNTSGVTFLTGANTYTGGTVIDGGSIVTNSASLPSAQNMTLGADGTLVLDQPDDVTFNGMVSGDGTIEKQGAGALTLANDTTAAIDIQVGSLILDDTTVGDTTVASGSFLRGNGTVNGDLFNFGTVSPGFSPGTIIVVGDYTQGSGGTLVMEIASQVSYDQLVGGGSAFLDGTLQIDLLGGYNPAGQSFDVLTAATGVNGTFSAITGSAALDADVTYNANDVTVSFTQTPFVVFAGTPNQIAIAEAALLSPDVTTALNAVPTDEEMPGALNALSPQGYQIWSEIAFARSLSLSERLSRDSGALVGHDDFYFQAGQSRNRAGGDADVGSQRFNSESGLVGGDHAINDSLTIGAFFEYTETDAGLGSPGGTTNVKSKMPGLRATWRKNGWFANAAAGYGFDDYKSTRPVVFNGTTETATSRTKGRQWLMNITGGRDYEAGAVTLSPFGGLLASGWKTKGFTETGAGTFDNTVAHQKARSLRTQLGLEASLEFSAGSVALRPSVRAAWIHELTNDARTMNGSFDGSAYAITTRRPTRDSARISAGLDARFSETLSLYADYGVQTGDRTRVTGEWTAGVSLRF